MRSGNQDPSAGEDAPAAGVPGACTCRCETVATRWLTAEDELVPALRESLPPVAADDTIILSEKVTVLLTGRAVPISDHKPGRLARFLVRHVQPRQGSKGLSVPEKMQYVISTIGVTRVLLATVAAAVTRPFGRRGDFYRIAGPIARDIDGGRPPYETLLFPPLDPREAGLLANRLEKELGAGVAIVDLNDYGGSIRGGSRSALSVEHLGEVLVGNPLGQRLTGTPFGVVRRGAAPQCR